ncbi:MAG: hypothetical protein BZ138_03890 [Methanosphaera sp. rholeuAM270]|nr:MAG: hypothetical protein BZ138_03890 [Methanosphaera sp. rholeuAM270]
MIFSLLLILFVFLIINSVSAIENNDSNGTTIAKKSMKAYKTDVDKSYDEKNQATIGKTSNSSTIQKTANKSDTTKKDTILKVNPIKNVGYSDNVNITGTFTDKKKTTLKNTNLKIILNSKTFNTKTDANGVFTYTTKANTMGKNKVSIVFNGNANYKGSRVNTSFNVVKQNMSISISSVKIVANPDNISITGKFTDKNSKAFKNSNVKITINNKTKIVKTDENGKFTLKTNAVIKSRLTITASHDGSAKYNPIHRVFKFENPDIRLSDSEIHPGIEKTFLALLPSDATGLSVFKINEKSISGKLEAEYGMVSYTYLVPKSLKSEEYKLYLTYSGDKKYIGKTVNATLTLTPEGGRVNADMTMKNFSTKYLTPAQLSVKLNRDAFGNITFQVNNVNVSTVKFANGQVKYNYTSRLTPGTYNLTAIYSGNYKYLKSVVNSTLKVNKLKSSVAVKNVTSKAGKNTLFKATVTNELGKNVKNMNVTFKLGGEIIGSNTTNTNGFVKLYYTLPSSLYKKTFTVKTIANTTDTILSSSATSTLSLKQLKTRVSVPNISTKPSKTIVVTATVLDEFNNYVSKGIVTFKKGNATLGKVNVSNGFAKFTYRTNYKTSNKTYIYASYVGDWKYASSKGKGTYQVTKLKTVITPNAVDAKPNSEITLKAIVRDQNQNYATDGSVRFTLNKSVIGTASVKNGVSTLKTTLKDYTAGTYRIRAEYLGSKIYKKSSNTNSMTVKRYDTSIQGNEENAVVGSKSTLSLTVIDEEKYNVNTGTVKYYLNNEFIGTANVIKGVATIYFTVPSKYDGKTIKYYANYEKNGIYESSSYSNTLTVTHQKTVYVSPNGSDSNLGDKSHPFKTIQYAVNHISLFGTVKLMAGTYSLSGLNLNTSVNLIGSGRDKTFIDGQNSGVPVFNITKRNAVLTMDSITIKNAKSNHQFSAGAIVTSGKLNIMNSRFINNTGNGLYSGGAIYTNGILNVTNTEFINNRVTNINSQGGAIRCYDNTTFITNCKFESNQVTGTNSTGAAAIYGDTSDIIINSTTFTKNVAKGKYITGGIIRAISGAVVIDRSTFTNNQITSNDYAIGGIIGSLSSGISISNTSMNSNTIKAKNSAGGAGVYVEAAAMDIKDSKINSNTLSANSTYGGVIYSYKAFVTISNSDIKNNRLYDTDKGYGGALYAYEGQVNITRTNFYNNSIKAKSLALAGAVYSYSTININSSNFEKNNINASNLGGGAIANMGTLNVTKTNFINNSAFNAGDAITATATAKNIIENNYWASENPTWTNLLYSVKTPKNYSKTKIKN